MTQSQVAKKLLFVYCIIIIIIVLLLFILLYIEDNNLPSWMFYVLMIVGWVSKFNLLAVLWYFAFAFNGSLNVYV